MNLGAQLEAHFGLKNAVCEDLNTLANDVIAVTTSDARFALKLYNPQSRSRIEVEWEIELTTHLINNGAPVAKPVPGQNGYIESFNAYGENRTAVLFEWASGEKPEPSRGTYILLGKAAAQIHQAADTFTSSLDRESHDVTTLIDDQLELMKTQLIEAERWLEAVDLGKRLKNIVANPALERGICHMDLTLDNVHMDGDTITVFDFDSAAECWRSLEPYGVLRFSKEYFKDWLEGYRSVRTFSEVDEHAVAAFAIIGDLRNVVWKLGLARSSRGKPLLDVSELRSVVDEWLEWERDFLYE